MSALRQERSLAPVASLWRDLFGNDHPVEVEIGPERGIFLLSAAAAHPERNYFGIERSASRSRRLVQAVTAAGLRNLLVLQADATCAISVCVPSASVAAYHVYFPDPWWKRRHERRRLLTPSFAAELLRTLVPGGLLHLVTDVPEMFAFSSESLRDAGFALEPEVPPRPFRTAFEIKAMRHGTPLSSAVFRKVA